MKTRKSQWLLVLTLIVSLIAVEAAGAAVEASEGAITIATYPWYEDANPVFAELERSIYYPYTRQDLLGQEKADRTYKTLCLENEYLKVTCLPELGGRIHSVLDKTTGQEMFHKNDVIKPALIAMRGAWISGGIEWNAGPQGHTVTIVSPVDAAVVKNTDGSASLHIANTEKMYKTRWAVRLTLHPGKAYLDEEIAISNPNDGVHPYYFWNCTAFPNLPGTRFIYPMTLGTDHFGQTFFTWPVNEGKDITWLKNYPTMSSIFGYECGFDFFGAYDVDRNRGIVSFADHDKLPGKKAWTWGKDDFGVTSQMKLSDLGPVDTQYIEVQSGPLLTQSDYGMLRPHQTVSWREYWYPVHGLGDGFEYATREACINVSRNGGMLDAALLATGVYPGARIVVSKGGTVMLDQAADLSPDAPAQFKLTDAGEEPVKIDVVAADGSILLSYVTPLQIPKIDPPDLSKKPARPDGQPTVDELYKEASLLDSQSDAAGAYAAYGKVVQSDPAHVPSLCAMAVIEIERAQYDLAEAHLRKALERDRLDGWAWYLTAVMHLRRGEFDKAVRPADRASLSKDAQALGYSAIGRAYAGQRRYAEAEAAFARALKFDSQNWRDQARLLAVQAAQGKDVTAGAAALVQKDPTNWYFHALAGHAEGARQLLANSGEPEFNALNVAALYAELGLHDLAAAWLNAYAAEAAAAGYKDSALLHYALAFYAHKAGDQPAADASLDKAAAMPADFVFPHGADALDVMKHAVAERGQNAEARMLLGYTYAGLQRMDEALVELRTAVELNPNLSTALRTVALHEWKREKNLAEAEKWMRKAVEARPDDQILHRDLCQILGELGKRQEAITLAQAAPQAPTPRYDLVLWLAQAYVDEARYDDCIRLLQDSKFSNWEGSSKPRDVFVSALMARGKAHFEHDRLQEALADFQAALEYPENLGVGARYALTDAEVRYWLGKTLHALGRGEEARAAWQHGADQHTSKAKPLPMITVPANQDEYVQRCQTALEIIKQ